jgi:AcrR family transcriptional regulator
MEETMNRNARRSVRLLKEAFLRILADKPYDQISVSDVTREADLNRGTFYAHFENMEDLLRSTMADFSEQVSELMDQSLGDGFLVDPMPVLSRIGGYLGQDRALFRKLVTSTSVEPFIDALRKMFCEKIRGRLGRASPAIDPTFDLVATEYLTSGVLGAYRSWLAGDYGDETIDELNQHLCALLKATAAALR